VLMNIRNLAVLICKQNFGTLKKYGVKGF